MTKFNSETTAIMEDQFIQLSLKLFNYYKGLGEKAMKQIEADNLFHSPNFESNSIAIIVQHLHGNMLSRWTDFLTTDGEKPNRNRDSEFEIVITDPEDLNNKWESGWKVLLDSLQGLTESDLNKIVYIRNEGHTVTEAITRQIAHYAYHVGQIVFIAKMYSGDGWKSLSIPKTNLLITMPLSFNPKSGMAFLRIRFRSNFFIKAIFEIMLNNWA